MEIKLRNPKEKVGLVKFKKMEDAKEFYEALNNQLIRNSSLILKIIDDKKIED